VTKGKRRIEMVFGLRAPPRTVFRALTDPKQLVRWFADTARFEARKGGEYYIVQGGGHPHAGRVLECVPGRKLVLAWREAGMTTRVAYRLGGSRGSTTLLFRQTGIRRDAQRPLFFLAIYAGWVYYLSNLRSVVETGTDLRHPRDRYW
jgi:uncharacterized protein YndB with AHSA1/START domain